MKHYEQKNFNRLRLEELSNTIELNKMKIEAIKTIQNQDDRNDIIFSSKSNYTIKDKLCENVQREIFAPSTAERR